MIVLLTREVDRLLQVHHGNVSLFSLPVVLAVDDDAIDPSGLNVGRVYTVLSVKSKNGRPPPNHVLPVEQQHGRKQEKQVRCLSNKASLFLQTFKILSSHDQVGRPHP